MASERPAKIQEQFLELVEATESDPAKDAHNYAGFWLPSIDLRGTCFTKPVFFNHAVFLQETAFSECDFAQAVSFAHACFEGDNYFMSMVFEDDVDFQWARFEQYTLFSDAVFRSDVTFNDAFVEGDIVFETQTFEASADFRFLKIRKDGRLVFSGTDLSLVRLAGTNLDRVDFLGVKWFRPRRRFYESARNALCEEFAPVDFAAGEGEEQRALIADSYRQLVINCERRRDFECAEDFHYGEMEMRRRVAEWKKSPRLLALLRAQFNAYSLYRLLSRYGTSYLRAGIWLLFWICVAFPLAFMFSGFNVIDATTGKPTSSVSYRDHSAPHHTTPWFRDYGRSINLSVSVATFQRSRLFEPDGESTLFLSAVESVIVAGQSALLLFAIRRRFKR
jgi:hypothetical protein